MALATRVLYVLVLLACCYVVASEKTGESAKHESATASKLGDDKTSPVDTPNDADDKQSDPQTDAPKEADETVDAGDKNGSEEKKAPEKIPFPNLEEMDIVDENWTPGNVTMDDSPKLWPGHMKPFGWTGKSFRIKQSIGFPTPHEFYNEYTNSYTPLHMKGAITKFDFYKNWQSDEYFLEQPPGYYVPGHVGTVKEPVELSFHDSVAKYKTDEFQFFSTIPSFLRQETMMPECLLCEPFLEQMTKHMIHLSSTNDDSNVVITETLDVMICVVRGVVELVLLSRMEFPHMFDDSMLKFVHPRQNQFELFTSMRTAVYHKARVESGDCLYIPAKWYRYVLMYVDPELLILSFSWNHNLTSSIQSWTCGDFTSNATVLSHEFRDVETYDATSDDAVLEYFARYLMEKKKLTLKEFVEKIKSDDWLLGHMEKWTREYDNVVRELFNNLDLDKDSYFSLKDLKKVTGEVREHLAGMLSDRTADLEDIMKDEYDDAHEEPDLPDGVKEYVEMYVGRLKAVVMSGLEELLLTGELPDLEKKLAEYDDVPLKLDAGNSQEKTTEKPVAGDKSKERMTAFAEFVEPDDSYVLVDDDEEEEIAMEDDDEPVSTPKAQKETSKTDTVNPAKDTSSKDKTKPAKETSPSKDKAKTEEETLKKDKTKPVKETSSSKDKAKPEESSKKDKTKPAKVTSPSKDRAKTEEETLKKDKTKPVKETSSSKDKAKPEESSKKDKTKSDKSQMKTESNKGGKKDKSDQVRNKDEL